MGRKGKYLGMAMKIGTWNVNGIRARMLNILDFIQEYKPDVLCLQEVKCDDAQFPYFDFNSIGYFSEVFCNGGKQGVAIVSKFSLEETLKDIKIDNPAPNEARYIESCFCYGGKYFKVASIYVPNGNPLVGDENINPLQTDTFLKKMRFYTRLKDIFIESVKNNEYAFFCGDYNVCPNLHLDIWNPKKDGEIINTEQERQKFRELLSVGMVDAWRYFNPTLQEYSWWGYRNKDKWEEKNQGYRLDAILCSLKTKELVKNSYVIKDVRRREKASDHIPMVVEI